MLLEKQINLCKYSTQLPKLGNTTVSSNLFTHVNLTGLDLNPPTLPSLCEL